MKDVECGALRSTLRLRLPETRAQKPARICVADRGFPVASNRLFTGETPRRVGLLIVPGVPAATTKKCICLFGLAFSIRILVALHEESLIISGSAVEVLSGIHR